MCQFGFPDVGIPTASELGTGDVESITAEKGIGLDPIFQIWSNLWSLDLSGNEDQYYNMTEVVIRLLYSVICSCRHCAAKTDTAGWWKASYCPALGLIGLQSLPQWGSMQHAHIACKQMTACNCFRRLQFRARKSWLTVQQYSLTVKAVMISISMTATLGLMLCIILY